MVSHAIKKKKIKIIVVVEISVHMLNTRSEKCVRDESFSSGQPLPVQMICPYMDILPLLTQQAVLFSRTATGVSRLNKIARALNSKDSSVLVCKIHVHIQHKAHIHTHACGLYLLSSSVHTWANERLNTCTQCLVNFHEHSTLRACLWAVSFCIHFDLPANTHTPPHAPGQTPADLHGH